VNYANIIQQKDQDIFQPGELFQEGDLFTQIWQLMREQKFCKQFQHSYYMQRQEHND
jgi:hypothetical protein